MSSMNKYDELIEKHLEKIKVLIDQRQYDVLAKFVEESLFKTQGILNSDGALSRQYLQVISDTLKTLSYVDIPGISKGEKRSLLSQAQKNYGRPALMLSGGGTFGIYHIGVVAKLIEQNLLPEVISGTSMGAIVAGILATHHDHEILDLLLDPEQSHYKPLKRRHLVSMLTCGSVLDDQQLLDCILENIGDATFLEAFERTGREVSITISPSRMGQKPRILNHQTSPNVVIAYAAKASCSIPGLFPACQLYEKDSSGQLQPYLSDELWYDGSFATDIPRQRISRLYNANYFIVSQANPHVLPFLAHHQKKGVLAFVKDIALSSVYAQCGAMLKVSRRRFNSSLWSSWTYQLSQLFEQEYSGDINIHPEFSLSWYLKFMKNPSDDEIRYLHQMGRDSAKKSIEEIRAQTLVSRTLRECIDLLDSRESPLSRETANTMFECVEAC